MIQRIQFDGKGANVVIAKGKTPRQKFMSAMMKAASGEEGEALAEAFVAGDKDRLRELLGEMTDKIVQKARKGA